MPVKLESFLALENALSKRMQASLTSLTKETYSKVGDALKQGQWDEATRLLQAMQLSKVFEDNKGYVTYLTNLAMLFGASRVTASPGTSVVGLGFEKNTAYQMVQTFQQSVTQKAEAYLKTVGLQLIAQYRGDLVVVAKANPYHDELGRFSTKDAAANMVTGPDGVSFKTTGSSVLDSVIAETANSMNPTSIANSFTGETRYEYFEERGFSREETTSMLERLEAHSRDHTQAQADQEIQDAVEGGDARYLEFLTARADAEESLMDAMDSVQEARMAIAKAKALKEFLSDVDAGLTTYDPDYDGPDPKAYWEDHEGDKYHVSDSSKYGNMVLYRKGDADKVVLSTSKNPSGANTAIYGSGTRIVPDHKWSVSALRDKGYRVVAGVSGLYGYVGESEVLLIKMGGGVKKADSENPPQPETTTSPKRRVLRDFQSFMDASGKAYFDMVSSLHTSRVSAYGFTAEAAALGIKEYQITEQLDNRICPVCATMHGRKFKVRDARRLLEVVTRVTDPDDLKQLQPWPSQSKAEVEKLAEMSEEELVGKGWHIPPFHPRCRGLLVRVGKVPSLADIKAGKRTDAYQATEDDFAPFGIKPGEALLKEWNAKVRVPPAEVAAVMGQVGIDEVLADLLSKMIPYLTEAKTAKTYVQVKGAAKIAEEMHLKQTLRFYGTKVALQELKDIPSDFDLKLYLRQLYTLAQDTEATSLEIVPDVGDLTALGFVASDGVNVLDFTNADSMKKFLE